MMRAVQIVDEAVELSDLLEAGIKNHRPKFIKVIAYASKREKDVLRSICERAAKLVVVEKGNNT